MAEERDEMTMELMEREQPLEKPENMDEMARKLITSQKKLMRDSVINDHEVKYNYDQEL